MHRKAQWSIPLLLWIEYAGSPHVADIRLDRVTKVFPGDFVAVDDVSLEIPDGQFIVLVGPSGCGKSTLLRMIAGLEEVTGGTVSIGGTGRD